MTPVNTLAPRRDGWGTRAATPHGRAAEGIRRELEQPRKHGCPPFRPQDVAKAAGVSEHQSRQAVSVANVPAAEFEAAIESDKPATVAVLAAMVTKGGRLGTATTGFEDRYEAIKLP
jgi:hypothetical protein